MNKTKRTNIAAQHDAEHDIHSMKDQRCGHVYNICSGLVAALDEWPCPRCVERWSGPVHRVVRTRGSRREINSMCKDCCARLILQLHLVAPGITVEIDGVEVVNG
jgi:hypothetical protein